MVDLAVEIRMEEDLEGVMVDPVEDQAMVLAEGEVGVTNQEAILETDRHPTVAVVEEAMVIAHQEDSGKFKFFIIFLYEMSVLLPYWYLLLVVDNFRCNHGVKGIKGLKDLC